MPHGTSAFRREPDIAAWNVCLRGESGPQIRFGRSPSLPRNRHSKRNHDQPQSTITLIVSGIIYLTNHNRIWVALAARLHHRSDEVGKLCSCCHHLFNGEAGTQLWKPPLHWLDDQMGVAPVRQGILPWDRRHHEQGPFLGDSFQVIEHGVQTFGLDVFQYIATNYEVGRLRRRVQAADCWVVGALCFDTLFNALRCRSFSFSAYASPSLAVVPFPSRP